VSDRLSRAKRLDSGFSPSRKGLWRKGLLGGKDRLDDHSAADAIARKMFKLRRHTLV